MEAQEVCMPALVIKDLPAALHRRLKDEAAEHHRSMTQEAIVILEQGLHRARRVPAFKAYRGAFPLTNEFINTAKRDGRA
jgi:plasmid stability protein